jgi:murein DD-endopeptidase MepM/ murein hydrolase activator NlpD
MLLFLLTSCRASTSPIEVVPAQVLTTSPPPAATFTPAHTSTLPPTFIPRLTSTPDAPAEPGSYFPFCTPLSLHPLEELPQIIGDPYKPPPPGREERHHGVDFAYYHWRDRDTMLGEPVQAALAGRAITVIDDLYPYGNMVIIETLREDLPSDLVELLHISPGESLYLLYAHLHQSPLVGLREEVEACQPLGEVGMSGNTDIPHLHLETRIGPARTIFESIRFYSTSATVDEMENYVLWRTSGVYRHFDPMTLFTYLGSP